MASFSEVGVQDDGVVVDDERASEFSTPSYTD